MMNPLKRDSFPTIRKVLMMQMMRPSETNTNILDRVRLALIGGSSTRTLSLTHLTSKMLKISPKQTGTRPSISAPT